MNWLLNVWRVTTRTLFFWLFGVVWTALVAYLLAVPVAIVERLFRLDRTQLAQTILFYGVRICSAPLRLVSDVRLPAVLPLPEGRAVVICNHHSYIDLFLLFHVFPRIHMSARRTLFRIPVLGWAMWLLQHFPHDPDNPTEAIEVGKSWLQQGRFVGVFPEGTRSLPGSIGRFKTGAFRLAQQTTNLIQPVVVVGSGRVWPKGSFLIYRLGPMALKVLEPVEVPSDLSPGQLRNLIRGVRETMLAEHECLEAELGLRD